MICSGKLKKFYAKKEDIERFKEYLRCKMVFTNIGLYYIP